MTEKRFTYDYEDDKYYDKGFFKDNGKELYKDELLELLNTLHEENEQLKQQDKINEDCYKKLLQKYDDLKKENEQLKHRLAISEKANFVTALAEENKQLKRRNKKLEKHLRKFYSDEEWKLREALGDFE